MTEGGNNSDILSATLRMPKGCRLFYFKFWVQEKRYFVTVKAEGGWTDVGPVKIYAQNCLQAPAK